MPKSTILSVGIIVALVACAIGFAAPSLFGRPMADQFATAAQSLAFAGLGLLLATVGCYVYRYRKSAAPR